MSLLHPELHYSGHDILRASTASIRKLGTKTLDALAYGPKITEAQLYPRDETKEPVLLHGVPLDLILNNTDFMLSEKNGQPLLSGHSSPDSRKLR